MKKKTEKNPYYNFNCLFFLKTRLFTKKISRTSTIHPGIFRGGALSADSVSPRMNTIASRDQFKPTRIGEDLVVNCNLTYNTINNESKFCNCKCFQSYDAHRKFGKRKRSARFAHSAAERPSGHIVMMHS